MKASVYVMDGPNQGQTMQVGSEIKLLLLQHQTDPNTGRNGSVYKRKDGTDEFYWMEKQPFPTSLKQLECLLK